MNLKNKLVLITGASSGIGDACAELFAQAGASLVLVARRRKRLEVLQQRLKERHNTESLVLASDVSRVGAVEPAFQALPPKWQAVDILINNAGLVKGMEPEWAITAADVDTMIDTNIKGLLTMTRLCIPGMLERGQGHVINLGSVAGREAYPGGSVYSATKFAVRALSRGLKMDLLGTPIRVTSIDPGMVETEFSVVRFGGDQTKAKEVYAGMTPLAADDIADAALYAATRPPHVNISELFIMPTDQAAARMVHRKGSATGGRK
ncbi:MAG: SDR family NAD(P)-dependent oxidoreductase [Candidatus Marinimicrobia bacterium]|nr:SDR family NAD(P)-dependent oxidoreductase [Candidatus Neomarinimicrobiota bacterium]